MAGYQQSALPFLALAVFGTGPLAVQAEDWPGWLGAKRDGIWRETGLLEKFPPGGPKVVWRATIANGYSGPAVADGRVYVMDRERTKDADGKPLRPSRQGILGNERVLCLNAADGQVIWKHIYDCPYKVSYPSGPRTTPLLHQKHLYTLGAMGDLCCLEADTGSLRWTKNLCKEYKVDAPVWGFAAHLLIDGDLLFTLAGGEGSAVAALNKDTGKEVWKALTSQEVGYSPPMIYEAGGKRQLIIWLSDSINGLDPATGKVYWTLPYPSSGEPQRPAVNIATVRQLDDKLFLSTFYHGPMMLKLASDKPAASVLWQGKSNNPGKPDGVHILMAPPVLQDDHIYGVCANGELRCLEADTGKQLWETYQATCGKKTDCANAFLVPQGDRFFIFNDQGDMILAELTPKGYKEKSRTHILDNTEEVRGRNVVWSHPALAQRCVFARNNKEIICLSLAKG
ncbi:MAG TPA: PQQ-binding-like beta-propeller repeat protein [Gemmataceae bacterium]|nr:PQQ-binding-like beta-propeller repeat protein [Gemmataceae bacterium]